MQGNQPVKSLVRLVKLFTLMLKEDYVSAHLQLVIGVQDM